MPKIQGPIRIEAGKEVPKEVLDGCSKIKLPFTATGFSSTKGKNISGKAEGIKEKKTRKKSGKKTRKKAKASGKKSGKKSSK